MPAPVLIDARRLTKTFGESPLFTDLSFTVHEGDRIGVVGPNGAGKSTFVRILAEAETPDSGECTRRRGLRVGYVPQHPVFDADRSVEAIVAEASGSDDHRSGVALSRAGFDDPSTKAGTLSGGWTTRLALACALARDPEVLLLDEPTNHLDLDSIVWLESVLTSTSTTFVVISHDRSFLQRVAGRMLDIDPVYREGMLAIDGSWPDLLEAREAYLSQQAGHEESLANHVRREIAWLRRGAKARTSKSRSRIDAAERSRVELSDTRDRMATSTADVQLSGSGRQTKRLWYARGLGKQFGDRPIVEDLELLLTPGMRLAVVGPIGSGKSTLLRMIVGELEPDAGEIRPAPDLRTVYFEQDRSRVDPASSLKRALAPEGDSVVYRGRSVHVASWARRFLFRPAQLDQPVSRLSGGERARIALARLMLKPADLMVLDEPTNDLDIQTLEVLEESLTDFPGALVLVSHDRYLVRKVATDVLGLDGTGKALRFADYDQWDAHRGRNRAERTNRTRQKTTPDTSPRPARKRLGYLEQREWDGMESAVLEAEERVAEARAQAEDSTIATDAAALQERHRTLDEAQAEVDRLYERWAELESKL